MYVCLCKGITDTQIKEAIYDGASSLRQVRNELGVMTQCGRCALMTKQIVDETINSFCAASAEQPPLYYAAG